MVYRPKKHDGLVLLMILLVAGGIALEMTVPFGPPTVGLAYSAFPCQDYSEQCGVGAKPTDLVRCEELKRACRDVVDIEEELN
ncbi:MAG: hypothetical protein QF632_01990 [Candidatus Woesearchaeota archaeon]|jgi:hypothetical protein|nr:hypothetical protein [Candidatus Woesearchaeota archaeon]MDP7323511.1 hypothetical protein [Candidatus Woesearchaeota archaeon]|tara:strand:+ start:1834 stop:2082 length:249 start_codon:yes stop_codon:yes gene_type:complete